MNSNNPTADQLSAAIFNLGYDDEDMYPTVDIPFDVWVKLQERRHIERGPNGQPILTAKGQKTFAAMESGRDVPEVDYDYASDE
jgi:hypothetical protein